ERADQHRRQQRDREQHSAERVHARSSRAESAETLFFSRKSASTSASPTATSAAATAITKSALIVPRAGSCVRAVATKTRLAALSISSTLMNITRLLRRPTKPAMPSPNSSAERIRYQLWGTMLASSSDRLVAPRTARDVDRPDHRHQQEQGDHLEGEGVAGE